MKKILLSALMAIMVSSSVGAEDVMAEKDDLILSGTTVNVENTETCYAKVTDSEYHPDSNYYLHFKADEEYLEVSQSLTEEAKAGSTYVLTVVAKPVSGNVWFKVGRDNPGWLLSTQTEPATELENGWFRYEKEITMTANQPNVLFHNEGEGEIYVDSISLKPVGEDKELLIDGGFDAVDYNIETDIISLAKTTLNKENTENSFVEVLRTEVSVDNEYSLHFYTDGDWLEVSQPYTVASLSAGTYTLIWYAKGEGIIWFYSNWGIDKNPGEFVASHAADAIPQPDGWTKYSKNIEIDGIGDTRLLFHSDGAADIYIDDLSLTKVGETTEFVMNGGFDDVTIACDEHTWDDGIVTQEPTVDVEGVRTFTCSRCGVKRLETIEKLPAPSHTPGDVNCDNNIDIKDVIAIRRYIAGGYGAAIDEAVANVNDDTKIDVKDVIIMRRHIAGGYGVGLK